MSDNIDELIRTAARLAGQHVSPTRLQGLAQLTVQGDASATLTHAWRQAGLKGRPQALRAPGPADLPFAIWNPNQGWLLALARQADGRWQTQDTTGALQALDGLDGATCFSLPRGASAAEAARPRARRLVWAALWRHRRIMFEALVATALINLLALATSLFAMQVFDRVIPHQGHQTLIVLTVGVAVAVLLELLLKQVRNHMVDRACNVVDRDLSSWFFDRMLSVRMEVRPNAVGTLASQVKGFELVRGVMTSTSLFVLADLPFAVFFVLVIAAVGGWVAMVPLVVLPLALLLGLVLQALVLRAARDNQLGSHRKAGLLVEAADGAESLKANGAGWPMLGRWKTLVGQTADAEQRIRNLLALVQNLTAALHQWGYIAIVAVGAWLVTENMLTMGGLLACSIISNRAMMPIVQLPAVWVQWAHARAATDGLDQILSLPSEADDRARGLVPQQINANLRLERVRFAYGHAGQPAVEVDQLRIQPGERVGLIGPVGAGKSSLLKVASGLYRPQQGQVRIGDLDAASLHPDLLREAVAYLPQDLRLFSGTLRSNLIAGMSDPGDDALLVAAKRSGLMPLIAGQPKGLALEITEGGRGVSGGHRQLIGLTRLLLAQPRFWMLDEPTGSMDAETEAQVVAALRDSLSEGTSALIATHKTALLPLFTRLVVMRNGRVILDGPRDQVLAQMASQAKSAAAAERMSEPPSNTPPEALSKAPALQPQDALP